MTEAIFIEVRAKEEAAKAAKRRVSVSGMLRILGVSRSGYWAFVKRRPSRRELRKNRLKKRIMQIYHASYQNYGAPKITESLRQEGEAVSERTVGKYMKEMGIRAQWVRHRTRTTRDSDYSTELHNILNEVSYAAAAYKKKLPDVSELVRGFHFGEYTDALLKDLSTGNKKKAFLITAFAIRPELLLLDEPVNGLDFQSTEYLYRLIAGYKEHGTVLFSSHILESITLTSDRVLVLEGGHIQRSFVGNEINADNIREALHDKTEL